MRRTVLAVLAIVGLGLWACETPAEPAFDAPDAPLTKAEGKAIGKAVASVTGAGHIRFQNSYRRVTITASQNADGVVKGQMEFHRSLGPVHGVVTCLTVVDTDAFVGGTITHYSERPDRVGEEWMFMVRDNGEGKKAPPDQVSLAYIGVDPDWGWAQQFCDMTGEPYDNLMATIQDIENGNIQVKGSTGGGGPIFF